MKRSHLTLVTLSAVAATHSAARAATVTTATSPLGLILVDGRDRTLYLFEKDRRGHGACAGACATYGPLQDTRAGQTSGQDSHALGAGWYVVSSAGKKIEKDGR